MSRDEYLAFFLIEFDSRPPLKFVFVQQLLLEVESRDICLTMPIPEKENQTKEKKVKWQFSTSLHTVKRQGVNCYLAASRE